MKKHLLHLSFAALIAAGAFWLCTRQFAPTTAVAPSPSAPVTCCGAARPFVEKADARESGLPPSADVLWRTPSSISALAEFQRWADDYIAAPSAEKAARGLALAAARRVEMISLIKSDPALALASTVPLAVRRALPAEVQALLEDRIDAKGDYLTAGVSFAPGQGPGADPVVSTHVRLADGRKFRAHTFGRREYQPTRRGRPVHGIALGNQLAVMELPGRVMEPLELAEAKATLGAVMCPVSELPTASKGREVGLLIAEEPKIYCEPEHAEVELYEGEWAELARGHAGHTGPRSAASGSSSDAEDDSPSRAPQGWTTGKKSILAVRVNFPVDDDATEGLDRHQLSAGNCTEIINRIGTRLKAWSYGRLEIKPVGSGGSGVTPVIHMDDPAEEYLRSEFWYGMYDEALDKAEDDHGYDDDAYDFYIILAGNAPVTDDVKDPDNPAAATWGGLGYIGEAGCMTRVNEPGWSTEERIEANVDVALHELGHNFGLLHSSSLYRLPPGGQWTFGRVEYGDAYDQMGSGVDFSAHNKKWLRWLDNANVPFLNGSGIHTIRESDMQEKSGSRGLQVKIGTTERRTDLSIEYRLNGVELQDNGPFRQWNHQQMAFGAMIRLARSWAPKTFLMDSTEDTPGGEEFTGRVDSPLLPGRTFRTSRPNGGNLYVTNLEADPIAGELTVDIQYGEPAGNRAPTGSLDYHSSFVGVGDKVRFTADVTDPDGDALAYFWSVPVLNGDRPSQVAVFPNSRSIVVQFPAEGFPSVFCTVSDRHGGTRELTAGLSVGANNAPTISAINDKTMSEDGTLVVPFTIGDSGTDPDLLFVTAVGLSHPDDLQGYVTIDGKGADRTLIYTPGANRHGKKTLQVEVSDGTDTAVEVFTITVLPHTPGTVLLPMRSANWRYSATAQSPPANWMSRTFDDSDWAMDNGEFSYPLPVPNFVDATNLGSVIGRTTCYFRRQFIVPAIPSGTPMARMFCDDGAVIYLNGVEVYRHNMPEGPITPITPAISSVEGYKERESIIVPLDPALLNNGQTNLIAVEVHDAGGARGAGDVIFDLEFILTHPPIVSQIDDVTVMAGSYSADADFTASDFESGGGPLSFTLLSSNPALLPLSSLKVHERPNGYYVSIKPPQVPGSSVITVRVSDGRAETWRSFTFTATPFNATPVIEPIADYSQSLGQGPALIEITLSDVDSDLSTLVVTTSSDADSVVPTGAISVLPGNDPSKRWLKITPKPATVGSTAVYVFVDDGSGSSSEGFIFKVLQAAQPSASPAKLIPRGSQWLMWAAPLPGGEKPIDFTAPNLDDSAWTAITTPAEAAIPANPLRVTTYFRRSFEAGAPIGIARLAMGLRCDDGAAIYLNGTRIWLNNLPEDSLKASTLATKEVTEAEEGTWLALDASPNLLKQGRNVLAVELHQSAMPNGEAPGDPVFDFEMYAMPQAGAPATPTSALITPGSTWHYWDYPVGHANDDLASRRWTLSGFDMGGIWKSGTAPLGYGTGEEATVINRFQDVGGSSLTTIPSALFRRGFDVPDPAAFTTLHLYLRRDDGAAVYLNGERILLDNLAPHDNLPTASALSPATVETRSQWHHSTVNARRLRAGRNYIAVSVHQHAATESILAFDLQLIGQMTAEPELSLKMQSGPEGGPPEISWSAAHAGWTVEHSTDLRNWAPYTVPPMVDGPKLRLWLTNPGERGFFRLVSPVNLSGAR